MVKVRVATKSPIATEMPTKAPIQNLCERSAQKLQANLRRRTVHVYDKVARGFVAGNGANTKLSIAIVRDQSFCCK